MKKFMKRAILSLACAFFFPNILFCYVPGCFIHGRPEQEDGSHEQ